MQVSAREAAKTPAEEGSKRRQIIEGARKLFLAQGFDAASMGEIARQAGVSKGTLYVYFDSKERLFEAVVEDERSGQAEQVFRLDAEDHDVEAVLNRLGKAFVEFLCQPSGISPLRTVMAIAERMPEVGRRFYENVLAKSINSLAEYLQAHVRPNDLAIDDCQLAAAQFMQMCQATLFLPFVFQAEPAPSAERIARVVDSATRLFLQTYKAKPK